MISNSVKGYCIALKGNLLPVPPSSIKVSVRGRNETVNLISGQQINLLKQPGLAEISFECLIPYQKYPFVKVAELKSIKYYLDLFDELATGGEPFDYILMRNTPEGKSHYSTVKTVTLEDWSYEESAQNGLDVVVSLTLKVYEPYSTRVLTVEESESESGETMLVAEETATRDDNRDLSQYYTVKSGDTLWKICKDYFGDGSRYSEIAALNGKSNPNLLQVGEVLKMWE